MFWRRQQQNAASFTRPELPDASGQEFCTRWQFRLAPKYSDQLHIRLKWRQVLQLATQQKGGGWQADFSSEHMQPAKLQKLADAIDDVFFSGAFRDSCKGSAKGCVSFSVEDHFQPQAVIAGCQVAAGYDPTTNHIIVNKKAWQRSPSLGQPVQVDGVYCCSKLEWLAHSVAHEMVHCMVHCLCPRTSQAPCYNSRCGHGTVFRSLNRAMFGHPGYMTSHSRGKDFYDMQ